MATLLRGVARTLSRALGRRAIEAGTAATGPTLTCRELTDFLWRYVERELSEPERQVFETHLSMCASCAAYLETYLRTIGLARRAFADPEAAAPLDVPEDLVQGILAALRAAG